MKKGLEHLSVSKTGGQSRVNLQMLFAASLSLREPSPEVLSAMKSFAATPQSLGMGGGDGLNPGLQQGDVFPNEQTDYIYPKFRVLSATVIPGYFIDFSKEGVLKESMALLQQQTLYVDHIFWRAREWVGVVNSVEWDDKPDVAGAPGINSEMKVDWRKAPDIARGLLMKPPAVKAVSATVDFEWDASHPELLEQGIFWRNLGQNIDDQIVRMIVTKITDFYEVSFVYKGANPGSNGHLPEEDNDETGMSKPRVPSFAPGGAIPGTPAELIKFSKEKKKMKFNAVLIAALAALGITIAADEEVAEDRVQTLLADALKRAAAADGIVSAERAEVLRLATIAEGTGDGDQKTLPESLAAIINSADASQLPGLKTLYAGKAEAKFTKTCQDCGSKNVANRSSVEAAQTVPAQAVAGSDISIL